MNRVVSLILTLCILLTIAGCAKPYEVPFDTAGEQTFPSSEVTTPSTDKSSTVLEIPVISASMPMVVESEFADDGTEIFRYAYQNMSLILPEHEVADKIIVDFLNRVDKVSADAETIRTAAKKDYTSGSWTPYLCQISYAPMRIDGSVLSLFGTYTNYSGSPHPESNNISVSYDLVTGDIIQLENLFSSDATQTLISEIILSLGQQKDDTFLFDDFEDAVTDRFKKGLSHEYNWYFSNCGICFYFSAYEIAPYASGVIVAEIPYEKLAGLMNDAYFPAEQEIVNGSLSAEPFNEEQLDKYNSFSEVIINKGEAKTLIHTDTSVYDVRIETGSWSADGDTFVPEHTVYAAYALTQNDAIMVESSISDHLPHLRITYRSGEKTVSCYLTNGGENGKIQLIDG